MITRNALPSILYDILKQFGGSATMMDVFKKFWADNKHKLNEADDIFYTWNYDIRWAATQLRKQGKMKPATTKENTHGSNMSPKGVWEIF